MKKLILLAFLVFLGIQANAQITFSAPVAYTTGVPTGAPSGQGSRVRIDLLTGWLYEWSPVTTSWIKMGQGIDQTVGTVAPLYAPGIGQSWFAVNGSNQLYRYTGTGTNWDCLNCASTSVNSVNGQTGTVTLDLVLTGTTLSISGDPTTVSFAGWDTNAANDFSGQWGDLANIPAGFADGSDDGTTYTAGSGISISGLNVITNTGDTDAGDDVTTATTAGGDLSGTFPNPTVDGLQGVAVSATAPTSGQVLKYNGTVWAPGTDNSGSGGDNWGTQVVVTSARLSGTGVTGNALDLAQQGATSGQVLKWNGSAWAPGADTDTQLSQEQVEDYAGGMVSGNTETGITVTYDDTAGKLNFVATDASTTNEIQNLSLTGQALGITSGTGVTLPVVNVSAGTGISVSITSGNATVTNTGDTDASNDITTSTTANGDLSGTYPNPTVDGLQGVAVSATAPTSGQVLKYNGTVWAPGTDDTGGGGGGGSVESVTGTSVDNTDPANPVVNAIPINPPTGVDFTAYGNDLQWKSNLGWGYDSGLKWDQRVIRTFGDFSENRGGYVWYGINEGITSYFQYVPGSFNWEFGSTVPDQSAGYLLADANSISLNAKDFTEGKQRTIYFETTGAFNNISVINEGGGIDMITTTGTVVLPRLTSADRGSLASGALVAGATIYCTDCTANDSSTGVVQTYNGSTWKNHW